MNQGWQIKLLLVVLAFGIPALRAVLQALARQRERAKIEAMRQRRVEEALRTGRGEEEASVEPDPVAVRRQAQLEELRRRARERAAGGAIAGGIPGSSGPTVPMPLPQRAPRPAGPTPARAGVPARRAGSPPPLRPGARQAAPKRQAPPAARPAQRPAAQAKRQQKPPQPERASAPEVRPAPAEVRRLVPDALAPSREAGPVREADGIAIGAAVPLSDWRRAIVMRELLAPPLALRGQDEGMGPGA